MDYIWCSWWFPIKMLFNTFSATLLSGIFVSNLKWNREKTAELRRENCMRDLVLRTYKNMCVSKHLCYNKHFCWLDRFGNGIKIKRNRCGFFYSILPSSMESVIIIIQAISIRGWKWQMDQFFSFEKQNQIIIRNAFQMPQWSMLNVNT